MSDSRDRKAQQFLWIVQTVILANNIRLATEPDDRPRDTKTLAIYSATGTYITCDDAIFASERIPDHMTAAEAAHQFVTFMLTNLREQEQRAGNQLQLPGWMARG